MRPIKEKKKTYKVKFSTDWDKKKLKWQKFKPVSVKVSTDVRNRKVAIMRAIQKKKKLGRKDFAWKK